MREVDARPRHPRPPAGRGPRRRAGDLRRPQSRAAAPEDGPPAPRPGARAHLPGADDPAESPDAHLGAFSRDAGAAQPQADRPGDRTPLARDARADGHSADAIPSVPARVLRRHAAANHDRTRTRPEAEATG